MVRPRIPKSPIAQSCLFRLPSPDGRGGFSLMELLVVVAIMVAMASILAPSVGTILRGSHLTRSGQIAVNQLALGRQQAISRNRAVEVRFFRFASSGAVGEGASGRFRGIQLFEVSESGTKTALGRMEKLPEQVFINSGNTLSTLLGSAGASPNVPTSQSGATLGVKIPSVDLNYEVVSFWFRPDGSTNLPKSSKWYFTLHSAQEADAISTPPADYLTVQIDPSNGHLNTYRP